jgi:putative ABC transport system permease protein
VSRAVPVTRRNLTAEPRRLAASAAGIGLAVMLVLLLDGLWAGVQTQATMYEDHTGAALAVVAPGTRNLFSDNSLLDPATLAQVRAVPGVTWAAPVRVGFGIVDLHDRKVAVQLVGSVPGQGGGPWRLVEGRSVRADDEVVVDTVLARRHQLPVGSAFSIGGRRFTVVGRSVGTGFMTSFVWTTLPAAAALTNAPDRISAVLVATADPAGVRNRLITGAGLTIRTRQELRAADLDQAVSFFGKPLRLMVGVAFAAGTLVVALCAYAAVVERRRDYGVVKALGATRGRLVGLALAQTGGLAALGAAAGAVWFAAGRVAIGWWRPQFSIPLTTAGVARAAVAVAMMALLAGVIPARRLARLDPAAAYRGA